MEELMWIAENPVLAGILFGIAYGALSRDKGADVHTS